MTFPVMKIYMHFTCTAVWHDIQGFVFLNHGCKKQFTLLRLSR